jgi:hypothetical protein
LLVVPAVVCDAANAALAVCFPSAIETEADPLAPRFSGISDISPLGPAAGPEFCEPFEIRSTWASIAEDSGCDRSPSGLCEEGILMAT